jgi:hypothetical protein
MGGASPDACRHGGINITRCSACSNGLREWAVIAQARERLQAEGEGGRSFRQRAESGWGGEGAGVGPDGMCTSAAMDSIRCSELPQFVKRTYSSHVLSSAAKFNSHIHKHTHRATPCMVATTSASEPPPSTAAPRPSRAISAFSDGQCHEWGAPTQ